MSKFFNFCALGLVALSLPDVVQAQTVTNYALTGVASDTFVRNSAPNNSFGTNLYMIVGGWGDMSIGMFKMNMSAVPSLGTGDKAELYLYNASLGGSSQPTQIQVGLAGVQWNDNWTWNNGLSWYTSTIVTGNISAYGYWTAIDITASYSQLKGGALANNGWLLVPVNINNYFDFFASVDHPNTALRPFLRVTKVAVAPSSRFLDFPLNASLYPQGAYTAKKIVSVLDHNMVKPYADYDGRILTFTGEEFMANSKRPAGSGGCYSKKVGTGPWSTLLSGLYYGSNDGCNSTDQTLTGINYEAHAGYDYRASFVDVYAAASGKVVSTSGRCVPKGISRDGCAAWGAVGIDHGNGYITQYLHNSNILVSAGDTVSAGQKIAISGSAAPSWTSVGPHLHFEVLKLRLGYPNDYKAIRYAYVDPYGFDLTKGPTDFLANTTGEAGGIVSVCLWKSGCTNP